MDDSFKGREAALKALRIPPEVINQLESIEFGGPITVVADEKSLDRALEKLFKAKMIGFDTESRPSFLKGQKYPVSIIQLSLQEEAFIFKLKVLGFTKKLSDILSHNNIIKVGVGVQDDIKRLQNMTFFRPSGFIDLCDIAKKKGLVQSGARSLTARYLGKKLIKSSQKTNWAKKDLTERQLRYAATDAWICLNLLKPLTEDETDYFALKAHETEAGHRAG